MPINYDTHTISPQQRTDEIGAILTRGGTIVVGNYLTGEEVFKYISTDAAGTITVEGIDGNTFTVAIGANTGVYVMGRRITASTAGTLYWAGGV